MAFDNTDQADLTALNTEVYTDPISMGYVNAPIEKTKELLKYLNDPDMNVIPEPNGVDFTHEVLMQTWAPKGAVNESTPWIEALTRESEGQGSGDISQYEAKYRANCGSDSLAALDALIQLRSRAEFLFGDGTVITEDDWTAARDHG
ncbi:MAG: hypothetical protein DRQ62_13090 [Gammaproteobacteria bacterium]|nr:MAG: hypothetical protein DRQ62_13090 [Gammaproteobacteria bacterium]